MTKRERLTVTIAALIAIPALTWFAFLTIPSSQRTILTATCKLLFGDVKVDGNRISCASPVKKAKDSGNRCFADYECESKCNNAVLPTPEPCTDNICPLGMTGGRAGTCAYSGRIFEMRVSL